MKNVLLTIIVVLTVTINATAIEIDTLWLRYTGGINELDFTPDDRYVIAWNGNIEFWEVEQGVKEFSIPIDAQSVGDYNFNEQYLVFAQDSIPKLLNWQTREVVEGFEKEQENIGRIRTAKSKNEFMANTYHEDEIFSNVIGNVIYFYDIDKKLKVDSIVFLKQFESNGNIKWKRTIHEYDYVGNNDELIYVVIDDVNDVLQNIPPSNRKKHYYVNFYNRETKQLVDSVYSFTNTNNQFGGFNKMQVMNDRTNIAWNHRGGEINFYDTENKRFYGKFARNDFSKVNDIEFTKELNLMSLTYGEFINVFNLNTESLFASFNTGSSYGQCKLSENLHYMIGSVGGALLMHPSTITNVEEIENQNSLSLYPNPTFNSLIIEINSESYDFYKLSLINLNGQLINIIKDEPLNNLNQTIEYDITYLSSGVYFIKLEIGSKSITKQFIKE